MSARGDIPTPEKVLIIKPSSLGDVVTALPVLRGLRRSFGPNLQVDWVLSDACAAAVAEDPQLDSVIRFDRKRYGQIWRNPMALKDFLGFCRVLHKARYDWVLDLQGLFRSGFFAAVTSAPVRAGFGTARELAPLFYTHRLAAIDTPVHTVDRNIALARRLGVDAREEDFRLTVPASAKPWAKRFVAEHGNRFVVAAPATRWTTKLYPTAHWRTVVEQLSRQAKVVLVSGPNETHLTAPLADIDNVVDLGGKTNIAELIALIDASRGLISCDSATMNIAAALGAPQVTIIGPTDPNRTGPYGADDAVVGTDIACRGCLKRTCPHITCMQALPPSDVLAATERVLPIDGDK